MPAASVLLTLAQSSAPADRADAKKRVLDALRASNGNITHAAPACVPPVSRVTLHRVITALGLADEIERLFGAARSEAMDERARGMTEQRMAAERAVKKKTTSGTKKKGKKK